MKTRLWGRRSLRGQLTRGMIWMQVLVLIGFTSLAAIPIINLAIMEHGGLDGRIIDQIAASISRSEPGGLLLEPNAQLAATIADHPALWIYATDAEGQVAEMGRVPEHIAPVIANIGQLDSASLSETGDAAAPTAIMRRHESAAGRLWIIAGGGPQVGLATLGMVLFNPLFISLLFLLVLTTFLVIPLIVGRVFRGVNEVAAQADMIDVEQTGVRLSSDRVPDELRPLVGKINAALQRLDEGIQRRERFLADAAHELRTPIAILQTRLELLPSGDVRNRLMLDLARLTNLANQLLDLQRIDANHSAFRALDLVELAAQVTSDMAPLAISAGDEMSFDAEGGKVIVRGDAMALSRALTNLIQNAIAHGGEHISIRVGVGRDGTLRVVDSGQGISEEHRQAIFEPFHRVIPLDHGAGLGLNMVKDIVARHDGTVTVGDAPGGGAMFEIKLPLYDPKMLQKMQIGAKPL